MSARQFILPMAHELIVDLFAGGGGASTGIEQATGRHVDIAINHDPEAVALHQANHPQTRHFISDVFEVDPVKVTDGQPVGLLWASPDCKHFSKAKGGKPVSKKVRSLAWVVVKWAKLVKPRVICLENVEEFQTWGPLADDGRPCPKRKGETFAIWKKQLENLGYQVEHRELRASDYGTPTIRKRLFLVARRDGQPIVWPEATHGNPALPASKGLKPWATAADCIDWSIPAPSIFERTRPLADATLRRIAKGIVRYVIDAEKPFIVRIGQTGGNGSYSNSLDTPLTTITTKAEHLLASPVIAGVGGRAGQSPERPMDKPMGTITAKGDAALVVPTLIQTGYGERPGQAPRVPGLDKPLGTVVAGQKHALVSAMLAKHYGGVVGTGVDVPTGTVTTADHHSLVTANLVHYHADKRPGDVRASDPREPIKTQTTENRHALVTANMIHMGHGEQSANGAKRWSHGVRDVAMPLNTITASGVPGGLVTSNMVKLRGDNVGSPTDEPVHTVSAQGTHHAEVRAFLIKYYGVDQDPKLADPLHTVTTRDRFGLVMVHGEPYAIVDIGLRMLAPRELYRAQGFPASYIIEWGVDPLGKTIALTKTAQVRMCGNSVCPPLARAIVAANFVELAHSRAAA